MKPSTGSVERFYGWKLVILLFFAMAVNSALPIYGLALLNVHLGDELRLNRATLGTAFAVFMLMTGLPGPLAARLVAAIGIRWTLAIGNAMLLGGAVAMATVVRTPTALILCAGLLIGGASAVGGPIPLQTLVTRWFARRRALAMGLVLAGSGTSGMFFPPLLEKMVSLSGWRAGWWLIALLAAAIIVAIFLFVKERPEAIGQMIDGGPPRAADATVRARARPSRVYQTDEEWTPRAILRSGAFWILLACSTGVSAVYTIFHAQAVLQMRDLGYSTLTASYLISMAVAAGFAAHLLISVVGDRIDPKSIWSASLLLQGIGIGLFAGAAEPWMLYAAILCFGVGNSGSIFCLIMTFSNWYGERGSPFVFGFGSAFSATCGALAPVASGFSYDRLGSFAPAFYGISAACVAGAVVLWLTPPPRIRRPA